MDNISLVTTALEYYDKSNEIYENTLKNVINFYLYKKKFQSI